MLSNYLYVYFWVTFCLFISPFRLKLSQDGKTLELKSFLAHKIICFIGHTLALFMYCSAVRHSFISLEENNPATYFKLFESIFSLLYKFTFLKTLWTKQHLVLAWANYAHQSYWQRDEYNWRRVETLPFLIVLNIYYAFTCILRLSKPSSLTMSESFSNSTASYFSSRFFGAFWRKQIIGASKDLFDYVTINDSSMLEIAMAVLTGTCMYFRNMISMFSDAFIFMSVLTLWRPVKDFSIQLEIYDVTKVNSKIQRKLKPCSKIGFEKIFTTYATTQTKAIIENYKALSNYLNQVVENVFMLYLAEAMFTYAFGFNHTLLIDGILMVVSVTFYISTLFLLILSGDICRKVHALKDWLYDNEGVLPLTSRQVALILDSISRESVGISIGGAMTINFSHVWHHYYLLCHTNAIRQICSFKRSCYLKQLCLLSSNVSLQVEVHHNKCESRVIAS